MTIKENLKVSKYQAPTQPKKVDKQLIILQGITTSKVWTREKLSVTPAYCFLKEDCATCLSEKKQCFHSFPTTDIPVIFRIKEKKCQVIPCPECNYPKRGNWIKQTSCQTQAVKHQVEEVWIKPSIKKGSYLQVEGHFDNPIKSNRKSFTAYSYHLLNQQTNSQILAHVQS